MGKPLGWGTLNNQPHIHLISRGYLLGPISLLRQLDWKLPPDGKMASGQRYSSFISEWPDPYLLMLIVKC